MKRVYICCGILAAIVLICAVSLVRVNRMQQRMVGDIDAILEAVEREDSAEALRVAQAMRDYWTEEERRLIHFVRHSQMDGITIGMAKLEPLIVYDNIPEFAAELESIRWQVLHVWKSEQPTLENIF